MRLILAGLATLGLWIGAAEAKQSLPTTATPAMWTMKDKGADLAILGSIHLLPPDLKWRTPAIESALKKAEIVVFEAPVDAGMGESTAVMNNLGTIKEGKTLKDLLPPSLWARLEDVAWKVKFPAMNLQNFEPWMAAVTLEVMHYIDKGFSIWSGVDVLLEADAERAGKKLAYLETVEEQLGFLARLPRRIGIKMLEQTITTIETKPDLVNDLVGAWAKGDPAALWAVASDSMDSIPEVEEALLVRRNRNWIPKIEAMAKTGKPHLIVVGAAHLAGPDSVIKMLRDKGWKIDGP
jgi:uncharacterized protein